MAALYRFSYREAALKYLDSTPPKIRGQIRRKIESLAVNPHPPKSKKLHGYMEGEEEIFRARSGDYRILYIVRGVEIVILDIGHRKDVYK